MLREDIVIRGAREHNLKDVNLTIPRGKMVVITGPSGSGKSSLAFDTLYAEGQRRYVESLSAYARQFLDQMDKPDVDSIDGLSPAISIEQKTTVKNPRSTVGTVTEIYDYLRVLYARVGVPHCTGCGKPIKGQTVTQMVEQVEAMGEGTRVEILAPVVRGRKGHYKSLFDDLRKAGFVRVRVDGEPRLLEEEIELDKMKKHDVDVVIDRIAVGSKSRSRLAEALELALARADGLALVLGPGGKSSIFSEKFACPDCGVSLPEMSPRAFSFNSPHGACPECDGLGTKVAVDPGLVVVHPERSVDDGAMNPWEGPIASYYKAVLKAVIAHYGIDVHTPWRDLPEKVRKAILYGTGRTSITFRFDGENSSYSSRRPFEGIIPRLERKVRESREGEALESMSRFLEIRPCETCGGARLRPESRMVRFGGLALHELTALSVDRAEAFFRDISLGERDTAIARRVIKEIRDRLGFLSNVGLNYLTLDRAAGSLSGGESQRIRLATQVGSKLTGVLYILDEPTIGLHPRDNIKLLATLSELRDLGNTVILVEHDEETIRMADHVIDMGPGAGENGGRVVAEGTPGEIMNHPESLTGAYLSGRMSVSAPKARRKPIYGELTIRGAAGNNLKNVTASIPLGAFVCVTGVSGSGKSSLVVDTLLPALSARLTGSRERSLPFASLQGVEKIDKVVDVNQSPIGRTPRSNPATYTGLFTPIRDLFSQLPEAQMRGYGKGRFSFNVKGGRCEACKGDGLTRIEMHFLPDVYVVCDECGGKRYNRETLSAHYKGASIADVLDMTVSRALDFFANVPAIRQKLKVLDLVGLGYIRLGQSSTTLSGGEAQRVKLAKELSRQSTGKTLYVLDEPTTGLHFDDVRKLLDVLDRLADQGNTVVVIEHNIDVIKHADHIIDLGPEGGDGGGTVVASGTPEELAANALSHTGAAIKPYLALRAGI